jgi:hypothetical protein
MPIKLDPPIEKEYTLERSDKALGNEGEPTTVKVVQARTGDNLERMELWKRFERTFEAGGDVHVTQEVSPAIVRRKEVFLTLKGCNLVGPEDKPLFEFPLREDKFNKSWAMLPSVLADEIHDKVLEVNPDWTALGEVD